MAIPDTSTAPHRATPWVRTRWWLPVLACLVLLTGCGASLVYDRLDSLVGFYIKGLVTLDDAQSRQLASTLRRNLAWHRSVELARYDASLRDLAVEFDRGVTREELLAATRRAEEYWRDIFEQAAPGYTALAATFTDAQARELVASFAKRDAQEWQEYARRTPEERRQRREKSLRRTVEKFTGPLDERQRTLVHRYVVNARPYMDDWRESRRIWREALAATLQDRHAPDFATRMHQLIARPDDLWTPAYREGIERSRRDFVDLLLDLNASLNERQRAAVHDELLSLADDVRSLARRRG